jgi:hypothetical protein
MMKLVTRKKQKKILSYLEFKLNKELNYEDTFEKDHKIKIEYENYLNQMAELKEEHFFVIDGNRAKHYENMKKKDKERFSKLREIGCVACSKLGKFSEPVIHHIRKHTGIGLRPPHDKTIPLCPEHHNMGNESIHLNKAKFEELFGTELHLLDETNEKIKQLEKGDIFYGERNK